MNYEIEKKIDKIINDNIKTIPYEGDDVNKTQLKEDIYDLIHPTKTYTRDEVSEHLYNCLGYFAHQARINFDGRDVTKWIEENL